MLVIEKIKVTKNIIQSENSLPMSLKNRQNIYISSDRKEKYHISIIDFVTEWNRPKKMEAIYKTFIDKFLVKSFYEPNLCSTVPSEIYQKRFMKYMKSKVFQ